MAPQVRRKKKEDSGLPLAISTPQWRFLSDDSTPQALLERAKATSSKKEASAQAEDAEPKDGARREDDKSQAGSFRYTRSAFLDELGEELADDTVPKEAIISMLEEAVGEDALSMSDQLKSRSAASERWDESGATRGDTAAHQQSYSSPTAPSTGSPTAREKDRERLGSTHAGTSPLQSHQAQSGLSPGTTYGSSQGGPSGRQAQQDVSQLMKNPRYMRQVREVPRRTSLGTIQGYNPKRNRNYREPKKVPAVFEKERINEEDEFWSDEDMHPMEDRSIPSHSPPRDGHPHSQSHSPGHGQAPVGQSQQQAYHKLSPIPAPRPQSPVIIWRPNASVRLASDLPRECLNKTILNPQQDMKLTDLIKSDRGFDPLSVIKANANQGTLPPEMKKTFSYYKHVSNTMPSAEVEKETLRSQSRPEWGKRIPPSPKQEYGAWYIPPEAWESDMRLMSKNKDKKKLVQLMGDTLWNTSIFDDTRKGSGIEKGLTELEVQEAQISEQIPNQYSSKMYKEYIRKKQGRLPHYLDRVPSPPPEVGRPTKTVNQNGSPRGGK